MFGIILVLIIAIMGGLIAYIGDKLGTKVGKKKLSVFGLRPKHTSILVTIITGILIAASTLGVLALTSQNVRTALFGMEALKTQLANLSQDVLNQNRELETSRQALTDKTAEYSAVSSKVAEVAAKLNAATAELEQVTAERDRTVAALEAVQVELAAATGNLATAHAEIAALQKTKQDLEQKLTALSSAKDNLQKDVDKLKDVTAKLGAGLQTVREGTVIYRAGEVLGNMVIPGGKTKEETVANLQGAIYDLNQDILERLKITDKSLQVLWISQAEFDQSVDAILASGQDMIVRILASDNTVYGEPVIGRFELYQNRLIYPAGLVVYSETLAPLDNQQQAEEAVLAFLKRVNDEARKQGILPDPLQGTVGSISGAQLFEAVSKVKRNTGPVEVKAVTSEAIYSAGPLKIEIKVQPGVISQ